MSNRGEEMTRNSFLLGVQVLFPGLLLVIALAACNGGSPGSSSIHVGCGSNCVSTGGKPGEFAGPANYAVGTHPVAVAVADFNGDGKPDLAVANRSSSDVNILLGNGDGTFRKAANYVLGQFPSFVAVGDFNGDHRLDLAVANGGGNSTVDILLGNGDGTFQSPVSYNTDADADHVACADFNGDGRTDLLISSSTGVIGVLTGNGDGSFQAAILTSTAGTTPFVALGDFNGDGHMDVVTGTGGASGESDFGNLIVLLGNGNGTFQTQVSSRLRFWPQFIVAADLNGDGKMDLAATVRENIFGGDIRVFLGNGDGTFGDPAQVRGEFASLVAIADLNNDAHPDLFGLEYFDPQSNPMEIQWMLGKGEGTFQDAVFNPCALSSGCIQLSTRPSWLAVADLNGDGLPDLVVTNPDDNSISVFKRVP